MGKRSSFERIPRDFYPTPYEAVVPLLPHLKLAAKFIEPCAGDGTLIAHLAKHGCVCVDSFDIEPRCPLVRKGDARTVRSGVGMAWDADCIITNPPWDRGMLHPIIENLSGWKPSWLLFDADWMHTRQSTPFISYLRKIVSVGRVKWIPDSKMTGKDNCCWYLFDRTSDAPAQFIGRAA